MSDEPSASWSIRWAEFWVLVAFGVYLLVAGATFDDDMWLIAWIYGSYAIPIPWFLAAISAKSTAARVFCWLMAAGHTFWAFIVWSAISSVGD